jgi:hypothetical protein
MPCPADGEAVAGQLSAASFESAACPEQRSGHPTPKLRDKTMVSYPRLRFGLRVVLTGAAAWACLVLLVGPVDLQWGWFRFTSRDPTRAILLAALAAAVYVWLSGVAQVKSDLVSLQDALGRRASWLALALCFLVVLLGAAHGTFVAGGADTYGYVSQAELWEKGNLHVAVPLAGVVPWPRAVATLAPLGYEPGTTGTDIVPAFPPGLPLVMVVFRRLLGPQGQYYVCPVLGALAVWLTFVLGRRLTADSCVGLGAAMVLATSPPFLFMLMPPMGDVPATAAWTLAILLALTGSAPSALASGAVAGLAVLIRPNLVPAAVVILAGVLWTAIRARGPSAKSLMAPLAFVCGFVPFVAGLAALNNNLYGYPWLLGNDGERLQFAFGHFWTNAVRFSEWMIDSGCEYTLLGTAAALFLWPRAIQRRYAVAPIRLLCGGFVLVIWLSYLFYRPHEAWWWLRYLLPMWPLAIVLAAALTAGALERLKVPGRGAALVMVAGLFFIRGYRAAGELVFDLQQQQARCTDVAAWVRWNTKVNAVFLTAEHSGLIRRETGHTTVRSDVLDPSWLDRGARALSQMGYHPYILLDPWEEAPFRRRFEASNELGRLDWPPVAVVSGVRIYDADRSPTQPSGAPGR